jgi:hypothetical protein
VVGALVFQGEGLRLALTDAHSSTVVVILQTPALLVLRAIFVCGTFADPSKLHTLTPPQLP